MSGSKSNGRLKQASGILVASSIAAFAVAALLLFAKASRAQCGIYMWPEITWYCPPGCRAIGEMKCSETTLDPTGCEFVGAASCYNEATAFGLLTMAGCEYVVNLADWCDPW